MVESVDMATLVKISKSFNIDVDKFNMIWYIRHSKTNVRKGVVSQWESAKSIEQ